MFGRQRCSKSLFLTIFVAVTYILVFNIFTLYHLSKSKQNSFVHKYGLLYLGHLKSFKNWTCKPVTLSNVPLPLTALASFPGSGNTWLRHLLQQATGISTGSEYVDYSLKNYGFPSEGISNTSVIVVKTHEYSNRTLNRYERAVLLIREPQEALLAEFNRLFGGHRGHAQKMHFKKAWKRYLYEAMDSWYNFNLHWLTFPRPIHIIMFNQLKGNTSSEIVSLLKFLNITISRKELLCVVRNVHGHFKRPGTYHNYSGKTLFTHSIEQTLNRYWEDLTTKIKRRQDEFKQIHRRLI